MAPYLNTDDEFPEHPKVDALSDGAFRLHVAGMHYCAKHLTDGRIPVGRVPRLKPKFRPAQLAELVASNVWHADGKGCGTKTCPVGEPGEFVVHDFLEWNKPKDWWDAHRAKEAKRLADWRARQAKQRTM